MLASTNFIELCLAGKAYAQEIDDYVQQWHESEESKSLQEYLGFTDSEYAEWLKDDACLTRILFERKTGHALPSGEKSFALAARASGFANQSEVLQWIKSQQK